MMTAYTHGVLVLSLGGQVAHDLVGSSNAFVNGAVLSLFAVVSGVVGIAAASVPARRAMILGTLASAGGMILLDAAAPVRHRAGLLSGLYLMAYLSMGSVALLLGIAPCWQ